MRLWNTILENKTAKRFFAVLDHCDKELVLHSAFVLWLLDELLFQHTIISQATLILFVGAVLLFVRKIHWDAVLTAYLLLAVWSVVNIITGNALDNNVALAMTRTVGLNLVFLYALVNYFKYINNMAKIHTVFVRVVLAFSVICIVFGAGTVLSGERLTILGANSNDIATMAGYASVICMAGLLFSKHSLRKQKPAEVLVGLLPLLMLFITILFTGSLKGFLIPFIGAYVLLFVKNPKQMKKYTLILLATGIVALFLVMNVQPLYQLIGYRIEPVLLFLQGKEFEKGSFSTRLTLIQRGFAYGWEHPFLGHGLDCFKTNEYAYYTYSHCNYSELFYSLGLPGLVLYYGPSMLALTKIPGMIKKGDKLTGASFAILAAFLLCNFAMVTYYTRFHLLVMAMAVVYLWKKEDGMKIKRLLENPYRAFSVLANKGLFNWLPDELFIKLQFRAQMGKWPNLENPKTYNEKLQWLKLHDRKPEYTQMVDKYEVRSYIANTIGEEYLIPLVGGPWNSFEEIDFDKLPQQFVLKCTHDSGGLVICRDKSKLDKNAAKKKIEASLKRNYYLTNREWPYKNVSPRIIAEQYMEDDSLIAGLTDYKFFCFGGTPQMLYVSRGMENHATAQISFYDLEGAEMPFHRRDYRPLSEPLEIPENMDQMIVTAKKLAQMVGCPFSRIDLYSIMGRLYFSEITFYPCSGMVPFAPPEWDEKIGEWIKLQSGAEGLQ